MHVLRRSAATRTTATLLAPVLVLALLVPVLTQARAAANTGRGPQRSITCPSNAVKLRPKSRIQAAINSRPAGTTFCLKAGVYRRKAPITPKSGNRFIGEYGAVIDGSNWKARDPNQGLFRAHNQNIDNVVIKNLVIRNAPQRGIHAYRDHSDGWVIEHNDIRGNRIGIAHGNSFQIRRNIIRRNWQYGITSYRSTGSVIEHNRFAYNAKRFRSFPGNAGNSKWAQVTNTVIRSNTVVDNYHHGIWFDGGHSGILIDGNTVRRNSLNGVFTEVGGATVIRNNTITGHHRGIYISESRNTTVTGNALANNDRAIWLFQDGARTREGELSANQITANRVQVPSKPIVSGVVPWAMGLNCLNLSASQCAVYSTSRGNAFQGNAYKVRKTNRYWTWQNELRTWSEWRAAGQDTRGSLTIG